MMRKSVFLTLLVALFSAATAWAFNPDPNKTYSLKVEGTSLYLDIQTLEIHEPGNITHSLSLNKVPCAIKFVQGTNGGWKMMNVYGSYASWNSWNTHIVRSDETEWIFDEPSANLVTIARDANHYIGWDNNTTPVAGSALYSNAEGGNKGATRLTFEIEEYVAPAFAPVADKPYYLMARPSCLFLDVETKGINEPDQGTTNNISLSEKPCAVYFEAGTDGKWKLKNANGEYIGRGSDHAWNAVIGATHEWIIAEINGEIAISSGKGQYIGVEDKIAGQPLYCNVDLGLQFILLESQTVETYYALKTSADTYLNFTQVADTKASFQSAPSYLYMIPSGDDYIFRSAEGDVKFVGSTHDWNVTTDFSLWNVSEVDNNGLVTIARKNELNKCLGSNSNTNAGTGIFTNVEVNCNKWQIAKAYPLTVVYKFNGEQETESTIVWANENHTIALPSEYAEKVITSCTATNGVIPQKDFKGTWSVNVTAATTVTVTLSDSDSELNGYYHIAWKKSETESKYMFVGHNTVTDHGNAVGYKMLAEGQYTTEAAADKVFALIPQGDGFVISAQGRYLKSPAFTDWKHVMFSDNADEAGVYVFDENDGAYTIQGLGERVDKWTHNDYFQIYDINDEGKYIIGNNPSSLAHSFTLAPATTYEVAEGMTALCLPFNVKLPAGVVAYDIVEATKETLESQEGLFVELAVVGDILLAGTPFILDAEDATSLAITTKSENAIGRKEGSLLCGHFVKDIVEIGDKKKYVLQDGKFKAITVDAEIPANSCWVVTAIDDENANVEPYHVIIDDWKFKYEDATNGIKLSEAVVSGDGELIINSQYTINGKTQKVVAITPDFLQNNETLTSVTLPASLVNLGFRKVNRMFSGKYEGQPGDTAIYKSGTTTLVSQQGMNRCYEFPINEETGKRHVVDASSAWRLTLDVTIDKDNLSFNQWGSAIVSTYENSLADNYKGYMQIYMWKDLQHIIVKIDNANDDYNYTLPILDENGAAIKAVDGTDSLYVNRHFKFEMEHDGSGGYQVVIYYDNGQAKMYNITATVGNEVKSFDRLYYSLPEGIHVDVTFDKLTNEGIFVGCKKLQEIHVDPANPIFSSCDHGVLYDKNGYYVMRIPEGGTDRYEIPSKVVKIYPGAVHGVQADVILHSNPQIGVVEGREDDVKNVKFHLKLVDDEKVKFDSYNLNTYRTAQYVRAPLAAGKYGTIILPFAPDKAILDEYEFFVLKGGDASGITFSQVNELKADVPYLYKLKDGAEESTENIVMSAGVTTIDKTNILGYASSVENNDKEWVSVGCYSAKEIITTNAKDAYYGVSGGSLVRVLNKFTTRPFRVYYMLKNGNASQTQAPARFTLRFSDGSTTEIDPSQIEGMEETMYYDLQGRRVLNPTNGVYIVNGKKVVVK